MGEGRRAGTLHGLLAKINIINALKCHCQLLLSAAAAAPPAPATAPASAIKLPKNDASDGDNNDCWAGRPGPGPGLVLEICDWAHSVETGATSAVTPYTITDTCNCSRGLIRHI